MKTFTDSAGQTWSISLTIGSIKRVKNELGVDLLAIEKPTTDEKGKPVADEEGNPEALLTRLGTDVMLLCDVIFVLVQPQADTLKIDSTKFGESLGGEVILNAQNAFYDELILFSQSRHRMDLVEAIKGQRALIEAGLTRLAPAIEKAGKVATKRLEADIDAVVEKTLGSQSTNSPEQSASTPTP